MYSAIVESKDMVVMKNQHQQKGHLENHQLIPGIQENL
jgi:hypothetical protein